MKKIYFLLSYLSFFSVTSQTIINEINQASFTNFAESYNYTYWDNNWLTSGANRSFSNQTSSYALNIDYTNLNINSLLINKTTTSPTDAFHELKNTTFQNNFSGTINYSILQNGAELYQKSTSPTGTSNKNSQMAEYGTWYNRRFVSTNFTNSPAVETYFTGIEFSNWHDRFKVTYHVMPTADILNGQLQFSIEIPSEYASVYSNNSLYGFADTDNAGFVVKSGTTGDTFTVVGNVITVTTANQTLVTDTAYEISIIFYALKENLSTTYQDVFNQEAEVTISAVQTEPTSATISSINYNADEGIHYIDIPRYGMGYTNCSLIDRIQNIDFAVENNSTTEKRVRLSFRQTPNTNVVGFNSVLRNANGDPSGFPVQVSKNWHSGTSQLFSGSWIKEYTEVIVPANTTLNFMYTRTGAKWGETYTASSHQLSVVGAGVPRGGWLEAALGSFGETVTHSPDYEYGRSNVCDVRPFLVTNQNYGGTSSECNWTGNSGGMDLWVYKDATGSRKYQSQVKTRFNKYSPNLTETSISALSSDEKLKLDYTFYLNRSDDFTRVFYKIKIEALTNADFSRFDIFQLGGDIYNIHNAQSLAYGNDTGLVGQFTPTNDGSNNYTSSAIALTGENPWVWAGDGLAYTGATSGINIDTNNAMIIRDYNASFGGTVNNTPYFRERSSSQGFSASHGTNPTSYCLVTPPSITSFVAGDTIELLVEVAILPKMDGDYYGTNNNFIDAVATSLTATGNAYDLLYRESSGNKITASSPTNTINTTFPLTVETSSNTGMVVITGGNGYVPLVFSGVTNITDPILWKAEDNCWEIVDQSLHGKDFWQANYNQENGTYELIYNVNQDIANDATAVIKYYLGTTPPEANIVAQSNYNSTGWSSASTVTANIGDSVFFGPQVTENGTTTTGNTGNWSWVGPNGYTLNTRAALINPINATDNGTYTVTFTDAFGCQTSREFEIIIPTLSTEEFIFNQNTIKAYPNPTHNIVNITSNNEAIETLVLYNILGQDVTKNSSIVTVEPNQRTISLINLPSGIYFAKLNNIYMVRFIKD